MARLNINCSDFFSSKNKIVKKSLNTQFDFAELLRRRLKSQGFSSRHLHILTYANIYIDIQDYKLINQYESNYTKHYCRFQFSLYQKVWDSLNVGGLRNHINAVEVDIYVFCKSPLQFTTTTLDIYLKLKFKRPDGIILSITTFPFKNRVKNCTGLVIFDR